MIDYEMARENFIQMGEMMMRFIYDVNILCFLSKNIEQWQMVRFSTVLHWIEQHKKRI